MRPPKRPPGPGEAKSGEATRWRCLPAVHRWRGRIHSSAMPQWHCRGGRRLPNQEPPLEIVLAAYGSCEAESSLSMLHSRRVPQRGLSTAAAPKMASRSCSSLLQPSSKSTRARRLACRTAERQSPHRSHGGARRTLQRSPASLSRTHGGSALSSSTGKSSRTATGCVTVPAPC